MNRLFYILSKNDNFSIYVFLQAGFLTAIASIGMLVWLGATSHTKENETKRLGIFAAFTFLSGIIINCSYLINILQLFSI